MLKIIVSYVLGPWGLQVLYYYLEHSAIINSIFFAYGLFLAAAHFNYRRIYADLENQYNALSENHPRKKKFKLSMSNAIDDRSYFLFTAGSVSLAPKKTSASAVKKYLAKDKKWAELVGENTIEFA